LPGLQNSVVGPMHLLHSLNNFKFKCHFDDFKDFYTELCNNKAMEIPEQMKVLNFNGLRNFATLFRDEVFDAHAKKIPEPIFKLYAQVREYLTGVDSVELIVGNKSLKVSFENMDIFCLLPEVHPPEKQT